MNTRLSILTLAIAATLQGCSGAGLDAEEIARVKFNEDGSFIVNAEAEPVVPVLPAEEDEVDVVTEEVVTDLGEVEETDVPVTPVPIVTVVEVSPETGVNDLACLVTVRGSLEDAVNRFTAACGITEYRDCDPVGDGIYQCANYLLGESGPPPITARSIDFDITKVEEELVEAPVTPLIIAPVPVVEEAPEVAVVVVPEEIEPVFTREADYCTANGSTRANAQDLFSEVCAEYGFDLIDCDPVSGEWKCASTPVGDASPVSDASDLNMNLIDVENLTSGVVTYTPIKGTNESEPLGVNWMDSYMANGKCFIESNLSYKIRDVRISTSIGNITVAKANEYLRSDPDFRLRERGDPIYNDVQCGNGPAIDTGEEDNIGGCPGRVDLGRAGCAVVGPEWNFNFIQDITLTAGSTPSLSDLVVDASSVTPNNVIAQAKSWRDVIRNNRARVWVSGFNDNIGSVLEYMAFVHPDADTKMVTVVAMYDEDEVDTDAFDSVVRHSRFIGVEANSDIDMLIAANME